jgi:hypothetical protein
MFVEKYQGGTGKMRVEVLYFDGCPTYKATEKTLRKVLAEEGMDAEVELVTVNTDEEARRLRFPGSPTIRLDGRDLFPVEEREEWRLGCRVYATQEGLRGPHARDVAGVVGRTQPCARCVVIPGRTQLLSTPLPRR